MLTKIMRVSLLSYALCIILSGTLYADKPSINITYDDPQLNFSAKCFMDELLKKATWPSTIAGFRALTQIGVGGCCTLFGIGLIGTGFIVLAQSLTPMQPPEGAQRQIAPYANTHGAITYFSGGLALTAAGLWFMFKKSYFDPDIATAH